MAYTVKITYTGIPESVEQIASPICSLFKPTGSYIDSAAYTKGNPVGAEDADKNYGKSIFATNVDDWGNIEVKEPFATTSIPYPVALAQFKVAAVSDKKDKDGHPYVEFEVTDYKEAFYYKEIGSAISEQGFVVEVTKGDAPVAEDPAVPANDEPAADGEEIKSPDAPSATETLDDPAADDVTE